MTPRLYWTFVSPFSANGCHSLKAVIESLWDAALAPSSKSPADALCKESRSINGGRVFHDKVIFKMLFTDIFP
jgi:hypothetical protein